jgi:hypothetical protein
MATTATWGVSGLALPGLAEVADPGMLEMLHAAEKLLAAERRTRLSASELFEGRRRVMAKAIRGLTAASTVRSAAGGPRLCYASVK